jgi:electron transfer flavoprotein beta subunit
MKIVVCVKYVPDAQGDRRFADDLTTDREGVDGLLSELDEYAVEAALKVAEDADDVDDATVTVLTMGPARAADAIRKSLQMGAHAGVHVLDDALHGSDALATSRVLAAAIATLEYDLVLTGMASTDGALGVVPAMLAERLGIPQVTLAEWLKVEGDPGSRVVRIERDGDTQAEVIEASLPAVVGVTDHANEPRYPSFKGIMAAKKKPVTTLSLADLGIGADEVGLSAAWTAVDAVVARPPRQHGQVVPDEGDGGAKLVAFLAGAKLV